MWGDVWACTPPACLRCVTAGVCPLRCICGVLKKKPRILVTHQLQYLKAAHHILVLKEVRVCVCARVCMSACAFLYVRACVCVCV